MTDKKWAFEDFEVGGAIEFGPRLVTAEEMIDFASRYDPQPMHLDEAAGKASMLGGLSAAGLFTASLFMRMMCDGFLLDSTSQGSPGIAYARWKKPVLAGDTLTGSTFIVAKRESSSRPNLGLVTCRHELRNQKNEVVLELENTGMFLKREAAQ